MWLCYSIKSSDDGYKVLENFRQLNNFYSCDEIDCKNNCELYMNTNANSALDLKLGTIFIVYRIVYRKINPLRKLLKLFR